MLVLMMTFLLAQTPLPLTDNLIQPSTASDATKSWRAYADATAEVFVGVPCLSVRHPGSWGQDVALGRAAAGTYAVLVGKGQSDRINPDGSITGQPYLYATVHAANRLGLGYWNCCNARPRGAGDQGGSTGTPA